MPPKKKVIKEKKTKEDKTKAITITKSKSYN